jgi:uncharacterized protein (TIGR02058 family)
MERTDGCLVQPFRRVHDRQDRTGGAFVPPRASRSPEQEKAMALKKVALEIGMGTDIRGGDYTKAAVRALRDALWHNSLTVATALGKSSDDMVVEVLIGVPQPDKVDTAQVLAVLPHGTGTVKVVEGGLEIANEAGTDKTVIAQAAAIVRLDL